MPAAFTPTAPSHRARRLIILSFILLTLLSTAFLASIGQSEDYLLALAILAERIIIAGGLAASYLLAAVGLGRLARPLFRECREALPLQAALGLALLLWFSHLLAWAGAFAGTTGNVIAAATLAIGLALAAHQFLAHARGHGVEPRLHPLALLLIPGLAVLFIAASNPPGWLWSSEFGGYDALSYHLALPQEWLAQGRLKPLNHNVYSYLPSYVEAAFYHLGAASFAPLPTDGRAWGLVAGEGRAAFACQYLHAGVTLLAAWCTASAARAAARRACLDDHAATFAASIAGAIVLLTPWSVVTGSLAYNDMGVLLMLSACGIVVFDASSTPARRGLLLGILVGAACSIKPTALFMVAPPVAFALCITVPIRQWPRLAGAGLAASLVMTAPWLIRNTLASGNPVFPFAAPLFASPDGHLAHWSAEQLARYAQGHTFHGSLLDRLRLLFAPEPAAEGVATIARYRGLSHPNFGVLFPVLAASALPAVLSRATHRIAVALLGALALQLLAWLFLTHLQSRFLLPTLPITAILIALALASIRIRALPTIAACLIALTQAGFLLSIFAGQRPDPTTQRGRPTALLLPGVNARTGDAARDLLDAASREERDQWLASAAPEAFINTAFPNARLYLLGGATPLYFNGPTTYNTTWDSWLIGDLIAANPSNPAAWSASFRERGYDLVLVDTGEIDRLTRSGWIDPRVRADDIRTWMQNHTTLIHAWPRAGVFLVAPTPSAETTR